MASQWWCKADEGSWNRSDVLQYVEESITTKLHDVEERLAKLELCVQRLAAEPQDAQGNVVTQSMPDAEVVEVHRTGTDVAAEDAGEPALTLEEVALSDCWSYKLEGAAWDASALAGLGVFSLQESTLIVACGVFSILLQTVFAIILYANMIENIFTEQLVQELTEWRVLFGHSSQFVDPITGEPLMVGLCGGSQSLMDGRAQAEIYQSVVSYGIQVRDDAHPPVGPLPAGAWLALLALLVWTATVTNELLSIISLTWAMLSLASDTDKTELEGASLSLKRISRARSAMLIVTSATRLLIAGTLGVTGIRYLAATASISELILNTVALEVVLHVDDVFFALLIPSKVMSTVDRIEEITVKLARPWMSCLRLVAFMFIVVLASHLLFLQPMVDRMQETADALCSSNTSFSYFTDAAGFVFMREYSASASVQTETYAYRAVFEATGLQGSRDLQPTAVRIVADGLKQIVVEMEGRNLESRNDFMPVCLDSDHPVLENSGLQNFGEASVQIMREIFQTDQLDSCASARAYCDDWSNLPYSLWRLRTLCPTTCGCKDALTGSLVAVSSKYGCPLACRSEYQQSLLGRNCSDAEPGSAMLRNYVRSLAEVRNATLEETCQAFLVPLDFDGVTFNMCTDHEAAYSSGYASARTVCPVTCGCQSLPTLPGCPPSCAS
ncbi:unnamed protein product [Symbiodinium natans]|uniref:Uncharacterized protein n=1 Tax=Symbiodinium natans TaxID=878477 RepID=A0A812PKZ1_9DINO|nr:unnamed protein product [Symbiodinium natans]